MLGASVLGAVGALVVNTWQRHRAPNLLLVTIDTVRADRIGAYGYSQAATPTIDALATSGVRFARAQSAAPLTGPSHSTILTGQLPPVHGVRDNVVFTLGSAHQTMATRLKAAGYETAAFVGGYPVAAAFGFGQGFDTFSENFRENQATAHGAERPANEVADAAIAWLTSRQAKPYFAWLHFYDAHAPYAPPAPYDATFKERPYDGEIAFVDAQLARVMATIRAGAGGGRTIVLVVADHGEALGEHSETTHAVLVYESTLRVPFIVAGPGVPPGRVVTSRVGTVDILPTVLSLLGLPADPALAGRDLSGAFATDLLATQPLYAESLFGRLNCRWAPLRSWTREDWKLIDGAAVELFNLADDPGENRNMADVEPERVRRMRTELQTAIERLSPGGDAARPNPVTPEQEERLRSLGYASGSGASGPLDTPGLPDPRTHIVLYDRAQAASLARGPETGRAIADLMQMVNADPGNPFLYGTLASLSYRWGTLGLAARAFAKALELDPDRPTVRQSYGKLLRELGRYDDSERELRLAVEQSASDDVRVRASLADTLVAQGKLDEAATLVANEPASPGPQPELLAARARLLVAQGRAAEAVPLLTTAASGPDADPWIELARLQLDLHDTRGARQAATEALKRSPGHPWALAVGARALLAEGNRVDAAKLLQEAVSAAPRRPGAWLALAEAFEAAGDPAGAARCRAEAERAAR